MFGYVMADLSALSERDKARYQGCYCGLCRRLGANCGQLSRLTLTYDLTFLILVLESVYGVEGTETLQSGRCIAHPMGKHLSWSSKWTDYGALMNVALTYYKLLDDWQDDKKWSARIAAAALAPQVKKAEAAWPRQCEVIRRELNVLGELEQKGICDPDRAAGSFGRLMGELFVPFEDDPSAADLRILGESLGQFIYLLDAGMDLKEDLLKERYNPLAMMLHLDLEPLLTMLLAQGAMAVERLPLQIDRELIENIIYSGVWSKFRQWKEREKEEAAKGGELSAP